MGAVPGRLPPALCQTVNLEAKLMSTMSFISHKMFLSAVAHGAEARSSARPEVREDEPLAARTLDFELVDERVAEEEDPVELLHSAVPSGAR